MEARRDVPAGTEITISYVPRSWTRAQRQAELQGTWGFSCECPRCSVPWDDTLVLRCRSESCPGGAGSEHGRVYHGKWTCEDCGTDVRTGAVEGPALAADAYNVEADLWQHASGSAVDGAPVPVDGVWSLSPLPIAAIAARLCTHPLLAPEDRRVFGCLNRLMGLLQEESVQESCGLEGDQVNELASTVITAIAKAALRSAFVCPRDLGMDIELS